MPTDASFEVSEDRTFEGLGGRSPMASIAQACPTTLTRYGSISSAAGLAVRCGLPVRPVNKGSSVRLPQHPTTTARNVRSSSQSIRSSAMRSLTRRNRGSSAGGRQ
jgi:hypothetical protein